MKLNSIKFKMSLLYTGVLGVILIVYSGVIFFSLYYTLYSELDEEIVMKAEEISETINSYLDAIGGGQDAFLFCARRVIRLEGRHKNQQDTYLVENMWIRKSDKLDIRQAYINLLNHEKKTIVSSENFTPELRAIFINAGKSVTKEEKSFFNVHYKNRNLRLFIMPFYSRDGGKYTLQVADSVKPIMLILKNRLFYIGVSIPVILICTSFIGRFFALRILRPINNITKTAENITLEDLSSRVDESHVDEEVKYLVHAFNGMISRLEKSFSYISEFSSHVAHELKTPIAIIRGEAELALRRERDIAEYKRVINVTLSEVGRMLRTIDDLLLMARVDYATNVFKFKKLDFRIFIKEVLEQGKILALRKQITLDLTLPDTPMAVNADGTHLRRLFFNLLDNAIKFTPSGGSIGIDVASIKGKIVVSVTDTGAGISEEDMPRIFDRFYHVDSKASNTETGSGLGLSIARSIAHVHHGNVEVKSQVDKGSVFTVILPAV